MHDWPPAPSAEIPSSQLVAAWAKLNMLPAEQLPLRAAHWLTAANDGPVLRELAALSAKDDPRDIRDLLPDALADCGIAIPDSATAAAQVAFTNLARLHAEGHATERWVLAKTWEIIDRSGHDSSVISLPLARSSASTTSGMPDGAGPHKNCGLKSAKHVPPS